VELLRDRARIVGELPPPALEQRDVLVDRAEELRQLAEAGDAG
jgi:hypothetical protein